jgi:peptide/nickel transport system substrate-binding protein
LEAGTIDLALSVPPSEYERLQGQGLKIVRGQDAANFYYFAMNTRKPPFDKKEVRQAIAFALDKQTMCKNVLFGISEPIELAWPKFSFAYFPEFEGMYRYDLDEAKRRLTEAGYPDGIEFNLEYATSYPEFGQFAEILKASLAEIGSTVNIVPMDPAQYTPLVFEGEGYQTTFSFAGGTQWYPTRISLSSLYRLVNNVCWPDGKPPQGWVDGIKKADTSLDPAVQKEGMKQVVETMMDEMWSMPIAFRYTLFGMQDYVEGFAHGVYDQPRFYDVTLNK